MADLGVLENFTGTAVHDHWKSYFTFPCEHALCNAHHLRELTYLFEQENKDWANEFIELLLAAKSVCEASPENHLAKDSVKVASIDLYHFPNPTTPYSHR